MQATHHSTTGIIDDIYAGTLDSAAWQRALSAVTELVGGSSCLLFAMNPQTGSMLRAEDWRLDPAVAKENREHWIYKDVRISASLSMPVFEGLHEERIMPLKEWRRTEIYNDFLLRIDAPYCLPFWLNKSADKLAALTIQGGTARGPFGDKEDFLLRPLMPHFQRALAIRDRLDAGKIHAETFKNVDKHSHFGIFILDDVGHVLETNSRAESLIRAETAIRIEADRTLWLRGHAGLELQRWIFTGAPGDALDTGVLHVHRSTGRLPLSVLIAPLPKTSHGWIANQPHWMVVIHDPEIHIELNAELLAAELRISSREAELAALLAAGHPLETAAQRLLIKTPTARAHLKSIFAKTGLRSQSDLVRRALTGLAGIPGRL